MNRRLILLNVVLLTLAGWLFWMLRLKWIELHQHEHTVLAMSPRNRLLYPPPPNPLFKAPMAAEYNDAVQNMIFAKDRNPNVIVDPPPAPPPAPAPPPMPDLPAYYGTIALFGDPVILLSLPKGPQRKYHAGDKVGPFQLVSFDREKVVFDWNGKTVERRPDELKEKEPSQQQQVADAQPERVAPVPLYVAEKPEDKPKSEILGKDNGGGVRMCVPGDTTPAGAIVDGYKKVVTTNMFGQTCMWQAVNP